MLIAKLNIKGGVIYTACMAVSRLYDENTIGITSLDGQDAAITLVENPQAQNEANEVTIWSAGSLIDSFTYRPKED